MFKHTFEAIQRHGVFLKFSRATWLRRPLIGSFLRLVWLVLGFAAFFFAVKRTADSWFHPWQPWTLGPSDHPQRLTLSKHGRLSHGLFPPGCLRSAIILRGKKKFPNNINKDYKIPRKQYFWPKKWMKFCSKLPWPSFLAKKTSWKPRYPFKEGTCGANDFPSTKVGYGQPSRKEGEQQRS